MALIWDETQYGNAYTEYSLEWAERGNYEQWKQNLLRLNAHIGFSLGSKALIVGCGFGYLLKVFDDNGATPSNVYGCDDSTYIQANKDTQAPAGIAPRILDIDLRAGPNAFKPYFGGNGKVTWVVSELVLTSLQTDAEIDEFRLACDAMQSGGNGGVAHIFASFHESLSHDTTIGMNWRTRDYWSARLPNHWLLDVHYWAYGDNGVWNPQTGSWS